MPEGSIARLMFGIMYRLGFTPWDGHPLPVRLRTAAEHLETGRALDIGCGTGDTSVYLARQGWDVTGVDFVQRALDRAQAKADAAGVEVRFVRCDVARLSDAGLGAGFDLIVDNGCLHGLSDLVRDACAPHLTAVAAPDATLLIAAFPTGYEERPPRGLDQDEIERRFAGDWEFIGGGPEEGMSSREDRPIHVYELRRR